MTTFNKVTSLPLGTFTFLLTSWTVWSLGTHQILVGCDGNIEQAVHHWDTNTRSVTGKMAAEIASAVVSLFLTAHYKKTTRFLLGNISHVSSSYHTIYHQTVNVQLYQSCRMKNILTAPGSDVNIPKYLDCMVVGLDVVWPGSKLPGVTDTIRSEG